MRIVAAQALYPDRGIVLPQMICYHQLQVLTQLIRATTPRRTQGITFKENI